MTYVSDATRIDLHVRDDDATIVSDAEVLLLAKLCPHLKHVDLGSDYDPHLVVHQVTDVGVFALATHCPNLERVSLDALPVTDTSIGALAANCPSLSHLDLSDTNVTDAALANLNSLTHLSAADTKLTNAGVLRLAAQCPTLTHLNLSRCSVTDSAIVALSENCPELEYLGAWSTALTDVSLVALGRNCPALRKLHVSNSSSTCLVSDVGLCALADGCYHLHDLWLDQPNVPPAESYVTDSGVAAVLDQCPRLRYLRAPASDYLSDDVLSRVRRLNEGRIKKHRKEKKDRNKGKNVSKKEKIEK